MTPLAAYLLLFVAVGTGFIFVHLVAGKLIRPHKPHTEKGTIYECGEPTIGSAWIQFDLRFYVVALLFVVFDVEVAFFFPWAEVFGKANAVANAPDLNTAERYNELGEKILDLRIPSDSAAGIANERSWKKMSELSRSEFEAYQTFSSVQTRVLRSLSHEQFDALGALTPQQHPRVKEALAQMRATLAAHAKAREAAVQPFVDAGRKTKDGPAKIIAILETERQIERLLLDNTTLSEFAAGKGPAMLFVRLPPRALAPRGNTLHAIAKKLDPKAFARATATADAQVAQWKTQVAVILTALQEGGPDQQVVGNNLSMAGMRQLEGMNDAQAIALTKLTRDGMVILSDPVARTAKEDARTLAWLALGEILVFFGVLLVGFAYLWKRGDLAWVRSTIAEQGQSPLAPVPVFAGATKPAHEHSAS